MEIAIVVLLGFLVLGVLWLIIIMSRRAEGRSDSQAQLDSLRAELQNSLTSNLRLVNSQLANVTSQVTEQLSSVNMQLQSSTGQINQRMDNAARMVGEVRQSLGALTKATEQIYEIGKDISGLQEILKAPKLRGGLGELFLGDLLSQCLPSTHFELQYRFANGKICDAIVKLNGGLVPIDSKFPLENFKRVIEANTDEARKAAKRKFIADCKKHIDAIASSYILPEEGTLNFALMYIPAENVYYEAVIKDEDFGDEKLLASYAFSKRVIPVSPNSFYAYMQTILLGLRGMEISEKARHIITHLEGLRNDYDRFMNDFETLGRHITNTKSKYDEAEKKIDRFGDRLSVISEDDNIALKVEKEQV
ncbi:MAG: DNA recombination protein RmuC [Deltaproteobacteria bacterium]|nr:DNA recombination protein RmuC [Deltaproteobacteria bacterium]